MEKLTTITFVFDSEKNNYAWRADFSKNKEEALQHFAKLIDDHDYSRENDTIGNKRPDVYFVRDLLEQLYDEMSKACEELV